MLKKIFFSKKLKQDEERFFQSVFIVFTLFSIVVNYLIYEKIFLFQGFASQEKKDLSKKNYNVLLEQDFENPNIKEEYKALSNKDTVGSGKVTKKKGFHTLSPFQKFIFGDVFEKREVLFSKSETKNFLVELISKKPKEQKQKKLENNKKLIQIPSNYRFQKDFLFNWNGNAQISIPTQNIQAYEYFKNMIRQIKDSFALPGGGNYAYQDGAGIVVNQSILPGEVKVQFLLNLQGDVVDVRLSSNTQSQRVIVLACIDAIKGQNFGLVPNELKNTDLIFGINFIFPDIDFK